ncbi:MAG: hypothetical protein LBQ01_04190, partial [Prevotellaceae bacterium]|nr:hypothetical protein [Prevotellaceae bacterium]
MIRHYIKVAFRNMRKYINQTLVSVAGLAVGFVCFAMATLWIRYEMTYDSSHKNAGRMYCVYRLAKSANENAKDRYTPDPLAEHLKSVFPEIANATFVVPGNINFKYEGISHKADCIHADSSFFSMFDVRIVEGSMDFAAPDRKKLAVTREKAIQMFGNESPVGKKFISDSPRFPEYEICAVVTGFPRHSNYRFDFLGIIETDMSLVTLGHTVVETVPGIDMEMFEKKLNEHDKLKLKASNNVPWNEIMTLVPLTSIRYKDPYIPRDVKFQHIIIFALAGSLLILCTLFNCLTLFVSRFRMREREFALRTVYGASGRSLFAMLSVEFAMSLLAALIPGMILINILHSSFMRVSGVQLELSAIYLESVIYIAGIIAVSLAVFFLTLAIFRRRTLDAGIRSNRKILRRTSIAVQLAVSIVFAFCTVIILKQMYYLHSTSSLGFSFENSGSIFIYITPDRIEVLNDKIKQIPEIKKTVAGYPPLLPSPVFNYAEEISDWEGKQTAQNIQFTECSVSEEYVKFYGLELIEGEFLRDDDDEKYVLINESAAKAFGWNRSAGKTFGRYAVKGVIKNINNNPTMKSTPVVYTRQNRITPYYILFKYGEGSRKACMDKIKNIVDKEFPGGVPEYYSAEEEYDRLLKSENTLLAILTVVSLVCLTVCVFGFVSMVSLTCEERRKEIAIRKINGATVKDILDIFFKEHLTLLAVGALTAFPAGYVIMKRWLENYVVQTEISAWIYVSILLALIMAIVLCVGGRVYRTSRENPVNAIN